MNNMETNLRQADAFARIEGILSEKNLERVTTDGNIVVIKGDLVIQVDELNFITLNVYVSSKKKDGKEDNPAFAGIETVMENYKPVSEVGAAMATRVRVNRGTLNPSTYFDQVGNEKHSVRYRCAYFNSLKENEETIASAEFEVEVVISNIRSEICASGPNQGEETGRIILDCWLPTYDGIEPLMLIAPAEDGIAEAVSSMFEKGDTVRFFGSIINNRVERIREIPVVIGKPKIERTTSYVNELVITGASAKYEEESIDGNSSAYNLETITAAVSVRKEKLEEKKQESMKKGTSNTSTTTTNISKPSTSTARDLPF